MLSRLIFPACAAILFVGAFNSAVASPTDSSVTVSPDSAAVPNQNVNEPAVPPKLPAVGPVSNGTPAVLPSVERDRLNSAIFASPRGNPGAITGGAEYRLPFRSDRSFDDDWRYRVNPHDDLYGPLSTSRQETVDRIGDMISPGFGRVEFDSGRNHIRIDYLYSRKCKLRGAGICFRMTF